MTADIFFEAPGPGEPPPRSRIGLTIIAQDPTVRVGGRIVTATAQVPWAPLQDGPRTARFHVVDYDASAGAFAAPASLPSDTDRFAGADDATLCTDFAFHAQQVYAVAARTLATFESALGRRLPWGFPGHELYLVPHAFSEANAFYSCDDRALLFGYVPGENGSAVYTCLSHDVVAHETTHAALDGLRHRFLEPGLPDQAALHEALADLTALLSVFSLQPVVELCLGPADANGRISHARVSPQSLRSSVLTGVAEQLGAVLTHGRGALRQPALEPPPPGWAGDPAYTEPHRRGEVLVAVVLDVLIGIWTRRLQPLFAPGARHATSGIDRARAAEEGAKAAGHLLTMLIRGLDYLPPVEFEFGDLLDAVLRADEEAAPDDVLGYRDTLLSQFSRSGITLPPGTAHDLLTGQFVPRYHGMNFAEMRTNGDEVCRFLWHNARQLGLNTAYYTHVESVQPSQRVGPDGLVITESVAGYVQMLELTAAELQARYGAPLPVPVNPATPVQLFGGGTLVFDQFGRAKLHISKRLDDWERQIRRLQYLHTAGFYDHSGRLGFSYGQARGQAFAELHSTGTASGEAW